ncbi:MAG: glucokinase [Leptothrix sp. (in: b-proteobacteria)]
MHAAALSAPYPRLVGDIGGTNARFGWIAQAPASGAEPLISDVHTLPTADHATLADAARAYLARIDQGQPGSMAFGIANPITGDRVQMTNHHWGFSISGLKAELGLQRLEVINDFTALALALPSLQPHELRQLGGGAARPHGPIALIGAGTGLGVSGLLHTAAGWTALAGEGGHVTLAAADDREAAILGAMRTRHGHVSAERALSGMGLVNLYVAACDLNGATAATLTPADITGRALDGSDAQCVEAVNHFCAFLGNVAGNLALTLGSHGGVYLGGGIVPRLGGFFDRSAFRARFEAKGRFAAYLAAMPVFIIDASVSPALFGAARALGE